MAKQTQTKAQAEDTPKENVVNETVNSPGVTTDAFGEAQVADTETQNLDIHNPYSVQNTIGTEDPKKAEIPVVNEEIQPDPETSVAPEVLQPKVVEPMKPTLSDQVIYEDFSKESTVKVENENGVVVNLSGTAAKILKNLDATTKIVK